MPIYQLTGLSGSGKTTLANRVSALLEKQNIETEIIRRELTEKYGARTIWIQCSLEMLRQRDPKGLYQRALLPDGHPDKIYHFTGVDDAYEIPASPELIVQTHKAPIEECLQQIIQFILSK